MEWHAFLEIISIAGWICSTIIVAISFIFSMDTILWKIFQ